MSTWRQAGGRVVLAARPVRPVPPVGLASSSPRAASEKEAAGGLTMARTGSPSGGPVRRVAILGRMIQLGRGRRPPDAAPEATAPGHERRIKALEERIDQLEA